MHNHRARLAAAAIAAALLATMLSMAFGSGPASAATAVKVSNNTSIRCAFFNYNTPTDWYFPSTGTPKGLVWLQHGFTEGRENWAAYGPQLAAAGYVAMATSLPTADLFGCTVQNIGNNTGYLNNIATIFGQAAGGSGALVTSYNDAARRAGRTGLAFPARWAFAGHSAGGEAVTYIAQRLRTAHPAAFARLGGLVLEDPVPSFIGTNMASALTSLNTSTLPVLTLSSPPYSCNNNQAGALLVRQKLTSRAFRGALVRSGSHGDVFGSAVGPLESLTCGAPQAKNVAATQTLSTAWLGDQIAGTTTAAFYPGGANYQALVGAGTIATLP